jgi:hypothetical protein
MELSLVPVDPLEIVAHVAKNLIALALFPWILLARSVAVAAQRLCRAEVPPAVFTSENSR